LADDIATALDEGSSVSIDTDTIIDNGNDDNNDAMNIKE
jgi:hypothetical protein